MNARALLAMSALVTAAALATVGVSRAQQAKLDFWAADRSRGLALAGNTLYVTGDFDYVGPVNSGFGLLSLTRDTAIPGWPRMDGRVLCCVGDGAGGWYIGGQFQQIGRDARSNLAHIRADYSVDTWNPGPNQVVSALQLIGSTLYVAGDFTSIGGLARGRVAAIDLTSGLVTPWNPNANGSVHCVYANDTLIYLGGSFTTLGGAPRVGIAAVGVTSGIVSGWNPGGGSTTDVTGIAVSDTTVYLAGSFGQMGHQVRTYLAAVGIAGGNATAWNPNPERPARGLLVSGGTLYAWGDFRTLGGTHALLATFDLATGNLLPWDPGLSGSSVRTMTLKGPLLYVGGIFTIVGYDTRFYVAAIDTASGVATSWAPPADYEVDVLCVGDSTALAGGAFLSIGGGKRYAAGAIDVTTGRLTDWDPDQFLPLGATNCIAMDSTAVYLAGQFSSIGYPSRTNVIALDRGTGEVLPFNPAGFWTVPYSTQAMVSSGTTVYMADYTGVSAYDAATGMIRRWTLATYFGAYKSVGPAVALALHGPNLYVTGSFTTIGGVTRYGIAAVDTLTGAVTPWNPMLYNSQTATGSGGGLVLVAADTSLYVSGGITAVGGTLRTGIAELSYDTGLATAWNPTVGGYLPAMTIHGNILYLGGYVEDHNAVRTSVLLAIDRATGNTMSWKPSGNGAVRSLVADDSTVYAGGEFTALGGAAALGLAAISSPVFPLDVAVAGEGSVTRSLMATLYDGGAPVTLTAVPLPGRTFLGWDGAMKSASNPLTIAMDSPFAVGAMFADTTRPLVSMPAQSLPDTLVENARTTLRWLADDAAGVASVDLLLSRHGAGGPFVPIATGLANSGSFDWTVTGPPTSDALIEAVARDRAGNSATAFGPRRFAIEAGADGRAAITAFALRSPSPNPASSVTSIEFDAPIQSNIRVALYDLQGRQLADLADFVFAAGVHVVPLDTSALHPGLYFIRMQAPHVDIRRRLVIVR